MWLVMLVFKLYLSALFFAVLVVPPYVLFMRKFPEGRLKRLLLTRLN